MFVSRMTSAKASHPLIAQQLCIGHIRIPRGLVDCALFDARQVQAEVNRILSGGTSGGSCDVDALARRIIAGKFGNGDERKRRLGSKYSAVQNRVNEILGATGASSTSMDVDAMARAAIRGDYGNGDERKRRLGSYYPIVQRRVNEMLS